MAEIINVDLLLNTAQSANSIKEVKASLKDLKSAALQFGEGSEGFRKVTRASAELRDRLDDINQQVKAFDPDKRLGSFIDVARGIAGGFSVATGALGLFGEKNEEVEKSILKVQSAIAILNGIQELANIRKQAAIVLSTAFTTATAAETVALGGAATATTALGAAVRFLMGPIGIAITVVTALAGAFVLLTKSSRDAAEAMEASMKSQIEINNAAVKNITERFDAEIEKAKAAGLETVELEKEKNRQLLFLQEQNLANSKKLAENGAKDAAELVEKSGDEVTKLKNKQDLQEIQAQQKKNEKILDNFKTANSRTRDEIKRQNQAEINAIEDKIARLSANTLDNLAHDRTAEIKQAGYILEVNKKLATDLIKVETDLEAERKKKSDERIKREGEAVKSIHDINKGNIDSDIKDLESLEDQLNKAVDASERLGAAGVNSAEELKLLAGEGRTMENVARKILEDTLAEIRVAEENVERLQKERIEVQEKLNKQDKTDENFQSGKLRSLDAQLKKEADIVYSRKLQLETTSTLIGVLDEANAKIGGPRINAIRDAIDGETQVVEKLKESDTIRLGILKKIEAQKIANDALITADKEALEKSKAADNQTVITKEEQLKLELDIATKKRENAELDAKYATIRKGLSIQALRDELASVAKQKEVFEDFTKFKSQVPADLTKLDQEETEAIYNNKVKAYAKLTGLDYRQTLERKDQLEKEIADREANNALLLASLAAFYKSESYLRELNIMREKAEVFKNFDEQTDKLKRLAQLKKDLEQEKAIAVQKTNVEELEALTRLAKASEDNTVAALTTYKKLGERKLDFLRTATNKQLQAEKDAFARRQSLQIFATDDEKRDAKEKYEYLINLLINRNDLQQRLDQARKNATLSVETEILDEKIKLINKEIEEEKRKARELEDIENAKKKAKEEAFNVANQLVRDSTTIAINKSQTETDKLLANIDRVKQARLDEIDAVTKATEDFGRKKTRREIQEEAFREKQELARIEVEKNAAEQSAAIKRRQFEYEKKLQVQQAIILGAVAILKAYSTQDPLSATVTAAAQTIITASNVRVIRSQEAPEYARGGILNGPSHANGGIATPFGEMEGGEAVINKKSTKKFLPILSKINEAGGGRKLIMATGGVTSNGSSMDLTRLEQILSNNRTPIVQAVVVEREISTAQRNQDLTRQRTTF